MFSDTRIHVMMKKIAYAIVVLLIVWFGTSRLGAQKPNSVPPQGAPAGGTNSQAEDAKAEQKQALAGLRERLAGHEDEPAEKFFKNIEILKGKKASRLPGMMSALTGL